MRRRKAAKVVRTREALDAVVPVEQRMVVAMLAQSASTAAGGVLAMRPVARQAAMAQVGSRCRGGGRQRRRRRRLRRRCACMLDAVI